MKSSFGVRALRVFAPFVEAGAVVDVRRHEFVVEAEDRLFVDQHVAAARLVLQLLHFLHEPLVVREERRARLEIPGGEPLPDEYFARFTAD